MSFVQGTHSDLSAGASLAFLSNNTAGNMLIVFGVNTDIGVTVSDTRGNTYVQLFTDTTITAGKWQVAWYALNCASGPNTVTISGSTGNMGIAIGEWGTIAPTSALDQSGKSTGNSAAWSSPSLTTTQASESLICFAVSGQGNAVVSAPFTSREIIAGAGVTYGQLGDDIVSSIGTYQATGTCTSGLWVGFLATFKALSRAYSFYVAAERLI